MTQMTDDEKILKYFETKFRFVSFRSVFSVRKISFRPSKTRSRQPYEELNLLTIETANNFKKS